MYYTKYTLYASCDGRKRWWVCFRREFHVGNVRAANRQQHTMSARDREIPSVSCCAHWWESLIGVALATANRCDDVCGWWTLWMDESVTNTRTHKKAYIHLFTYSVGLATVLHETGKNKYTCPTTDRLVEFIVFVVVLRHYCQYESFMSIRLVRAIRNSAL